MGGRTIFVRAANRVLAPLGLTLAKRPRRDRSPPGVLRHLDIGLLLDVGANTGQFARNARLAGYGGRIVSFEPLPQAHASLKDNAAHDRLWTVHERAALGAAPGSAVIHVAGNSESSSLLPMGAAHLAAAPQSAYVGVAETPMVTLDAMVALYRRDGERMFLKIDTQGTETDVLAGGKQVLAAMSGVQLEMSLVPLYDGQELYRPLLDRLEGAGFALWDLIPGFRDGQSGRLLQFDAVFVRPG